MESARAWAQLMAAVGHVQLLASRVEDDQVRRLTVDLLQRALHMQEGDEDQALQALRKISDGYGPLVTRIGQLLREQY
jgi:hypothetical protein